MYIGKLKAKCHGFIKLIVHSSTLANSSVRWSTILGYQFLVYFYSKHLISSAKPGLQEKPKGQAVKEDNSVFPSQKEKTGWWSEKSFNAGVKLAVLLQQNGQFHAICWWPIWQRQ